MARGDRFKQRLPAFIGRIPDFLDLFIAEDIEFDRIDDLLKDMRYSLNAHTIPRMKRPQGDLERYEKDYGLVKKGTIADRVQAILRKIRLQEPTTEEAVLNICKSYGFRGIFEQRYKEYGFTVWILNPQDFDGSLREAIHEAKPAHLELVMAFIYHQELELETRQGDHSWPLWKCGRHKTGTLPRPAFKGEREIIHLNLGLAERTGRERHYWPGLKSGDKVYTKLSEPILRQLSPLDRDFTKANIYIFGGVKEDADTENL